MLFANGEVFWKSPTVYDVMGLAGFALGLASIWLSWWLAKRDIEKRLDEAADRASKAARDEVRRVAQVVLQSGVGATVRSLDLAREACRGKRLSRACELCELAREQLARVLVQPAASNDTRAELQEVSATLTDCIKRLRKQVKSGSEEVPDPVLRGLDESILALHRVDGRMSSINPEVGHD